MKHKLLSILLCLAMALSLLPTAALAEGETGTTGTTITTSEELVAAIKDASDGRRAARRCGLLHKFEQFIWEVS